MLQCVVSVTASENAMRTPAIVVPRCRRPGVQPRLEDDGREVRRCRKQQGFHSRSALSAQLDPKVPRNSHADDWHYVGINAMLANEVAECLLNWWGLVANRQDPASDCGSLRMRNTPFALRAAWVKRGWSL